MKKIFTLIIILFQFTSYSQVRMAVCGTDEIIAKEKAANTEYAKRLEMTKAYLKEKNITNYKTVVTGSGTEYHVPVIVHVMHTGGIEGSNYNPSVATINAFIAQLNNGFANTFDNSSVAGMFNSVSMPIRFYLAQRDESNSCSPTTGINRVDMSLNATYVASGVSAGGSGITDASLKSVVHWNDLNYYNIYIVNKINGEDGFTTVGSYIAGYAYYPVLGGQDVDGMVVLAYQATFANTTVFIHEMGHGFDLAHTFDGGTTTTCPANANCLTDNDGICDTEPIRNMFTCNPSGTNPCTSQNWNLNTVQWNYMSYNGCTDRFTNGQSVKINDVLANVRTSYKNSAGLDAPVPLPTTITPPTFNVANNGNNFDRGPEYVELNSIQHSSHGYSNEGNGSIFYVDNTCNQATQLIGTTSYPVTITTRGNSQRVAMYIDYNNDGVFGTSAPELIFTSTGISGTYNHTTTLNIPASGVAYNTPLRMRVLADNSSSTMSPTMQLTSGQAEDFSVTISQYPLPVTWRSIDSRILENNEIEVYWSTASEMNNDRFEIEKSRDGKNFETIGTIKGFGNSDVATYYSFIDKKTTNGVQYYRIKQIDIDGKFSYSTVVNEIINSKDFTVQLFPNPANNELNIQLNGLNTNTSKIEYAIKDLDGKTLLRKETKLNESYFIGNENISFLPSGIYFLELKVNQEKSIHRIIKD
ncbi:MAG: zinc-dependent metalloprotease [Chitinophagaceae bacterium]|nr:zinc-dependent metalloprotease [Chitinophagaceae bacterium]